MKNKHVIYGIRMVMIMLAITIFSILLNWMGIGKENVLMLFIVGVLLLRTVPMDISMELLPP